MERCFPTHYAAVFLWGIAVFLGMIGLGRAVALVAGGEPARKAGWGLHAVWGMGVYLFLGGLLGVFGACVQTNITLLIAAGIAILIWTTFRAWRPTGASLKAIPLGAWPIFAVLALTYATGIFQQAYQNEADDFPAYFSFCEKLLETGSFEDPFSWRRLASLGGHTLLQCSVLAQASWANAQAFEVALCPVILFGIILGFRGGALARSPWGLFLGLIAVTTPILRSNTASHFTGVIMLVGLFVTLDLVEHAETRRRQLLAVAGLVGAGLCSLRAQDIPAAGCALGLFWLGSWMKDKRPARAALLEAVCWGAGLFVALLPWMIMSFTSSGSPLYPLFQGNNNQAFNPQRVDMPFFSVSNSVFQMIAFPALVPLILCSLASAIWRPGLAALAVAVSAALTSLAVAYGLNLAPDAMTIARYVQPLLLAGALAVLMTGVIAPRFRLIAAAMATLLLAASLPERGKDLVGRCMGLAHPHSYGSKMPASFHSSVVANYRDAQSLIPEGKRVLVCTDFPFLFDFQRNPIWIVDIPQAASPRPGLPFRKPTEETKRYLRGLGVDYVIYPDFSKESALYNRARWTKIKTGGVLLFRIEAPFCLDFFDTIERLASADATLGRVGDLTVIQLKP